MGFYTPPPWGFAYEEQKVAANLVNGIGAGRVRRRALVYYQCPHGHPLGFAWPYVRSDHPEAVVRGDEFLAEPGKHRAFGPSMKLDVEHNGVPVPVTDYVFFAHRRIDPEYEFYGDPSNPAETVGWGPAGVIALEEGTSSFNVSRQVNYEQNLRIGEDADSPEEMNIIGKRDVIRAITGWRWLVAEMHPPVFELDNPPGLVNCRDIEVFLSRIRVQTDIKRYRGKPITLGR